MSERFKQSTVKGGVSDVILVYDLQEKNLVVPLCDYAVYLQRYRGNSRLTLEQEIGHLRVFWSFLKSRNITFDKVDDKLLEEFRELAKSRAMQNPAHRGSVQAAERTVNAKLMRIYNWLVWLRDTGAGPSWLIGRVDCLVTSTLVSGERDRGRSISDSRDRFPLLFNVADRSSKHRLPRVLPTEDTLTSAHRIFFDQARDLHTAHRNCLLLDIASVTGFRRGSINSLTVDQFTGTDYVETRNGTVVIRPKKQKFGYGDTFEIPTFLHEQVKRFIIEHRNPFVESKCVKQSIHRGAVFLSNKTGAPLTDRSQTAIVSPVMRKLGLKKGSVLHVWRSKFAVEEVEKEYVDRKELELDTSPQSIQLAVSTALGHRHPESIRPYISAFEASKVSARRAKEREAMRNEKERMSQLERENRVLRAKLGVGDT